MELAREKDEAFGIEMDGLGNLERWSKFSPREHTHTFTTITSLTDKADDRAAFNTVCQPTTPGRLQVCGPLEATGIGIIGMTSGRGKGRSKS